MQWQKWASIVFQPKKKKKEHLFLLMDTRELTEMKYV